MNRDCENIGEYMETINTRKMPNEGLLFQITMNLPPGRKEEKHMASRWEIIEELERRGFDRYEADQWLRDRDPFDKGMDRYEDERDIADRLIRENR